jgi:hypothetical protein
MTRGFQTAALTGALTLVSLIAVRAQAPGAPAPKPTTEEKRIALGLAMAPVPLDLTGKNQALVGLGSYIVNAQAGCLDCHSYPVYQDGGDPHLGQPEKISQETYLSGGSPNFGPFVPRNITPDGSGKPAGMTFLEFRHVMRSGEDEDYAPPHVPSDDLDLLQVMPWPVYAKMSQHDLQAIYEYLRAIPCIGDATRCGP